MYPEEEGHVNRVKSLVERDRLDVKKNVEHLDLPALHAHCRVDHRLLEIGEIDLQVLQAVLVAAAVIYSCSVHANRFFETICVVCAVSIQISHNNPPNMILRL